MNLRPRLCKGMPGAGVAYTAAHQRKLLQQVVAQKVLCEVYFAQQEGVVYGKRLHERLTPTSAASKSSYAELSFLYKLLHARKMLPKMWGLF